MRKVSISYFLCLLLITISGCNKNDDPSPDDSNNSNTPKGMVLVHLHNFIDESEVDSYNVIYTTTAGRKIKLTKAQFYLSGFELVRLDGSVYSIPDKYILKVQETQSYQIGEVPVGNYKTLRFKVGLSSTINAQVPTTSSSDILNKPDMWFSSTAQPDGYVFAHIAGKIDTTVAGDAIEADMVSFQYRIGTNDQYTQITMPNKNFSVVANQAQYAHMYIDISKLFSGLDLQNENNLIMTSTADNATTLGTTLSNNLTEMFRYEE